MNRRLLLFLLLAALGATAWYLAGSRGSTTLDRPLSDFMVADTSQVDRIFIAEHNGKWVDLRRRPDGSWSLNDIYKAKKHEVDLLLRTFLRVEVKAPVPKSAEENVLRVMSASASKVEIYTGGKKPEKIWIVGHGTKDHFGTYMLLEKPGIGRSSSPFIMGMSRFTGVLNTRFHADLDTWRDTEVYAFDDVYEVAAVEMTRTGEPEASYRVEQPAPGLVKLLDPAGRPLPTDTLLVKGYLLAFERLNYEYIERNMDRRQRDSLIATPPSHVLAITARDGGTKRIKFWWKPYEGDLTAPEAVQAEHDKVRMQALVQDTLLVTVQRQMFDVVLQPREFLLP